MTGLVFAGFGGQGILFAGKVVAYAGLMEGKRVSWLPSYGPAMRGGTANCSVCISDTEIGSPLVTEPDILVAMNQPSFDSFVGKVRPGGLVVVDSDLVEIEGARSDVRIEGLPATALCAEAGFKGLANIILLGRLFRVTGMFSDEAVEKGIRKSVPARKQELLEANFKAIQMGGEEHTL